MGFGIDGRDLPLLRSYARAKEKYDSITPIRGTNNVRPLGGRRKQHQRIEVAKRNGAGAAGLACVLYNTACVTYYEDGTIHLAHDGHVSQSTCTFINRVAPVSGVRMDKQRDCLVVRVAGGEYKCGKDGLWLKYDETATVYVPVDPEPFKVTLVNRVAMREVKKQYAAFMQYAVGLGKLTQWDRPEMEGHRWVDEKDVLNCMRGEDIDQWAWAYPRLLLAAGSIRQRFDYQARQWEHKWLCDKKRLDAHLTHMVKKAHASEVLVRVTLPLGEHKKDANYKYHREM
jgi:ribosomal protein L14